MDRLFLVGRLGKLNAAHGHQLGDRHELQAQLLAIILHRVGQNFEGVVAVQVKQNDGYFFASIRLKARISFRLITARPATITP